MHGSISKFGNERLLLNVMITEIRTISFVSSGVLVLQELRLFQREPRSTSTDYEPKGLRAVSVQQASDLARDPYCCGYYSGHTAHHGSFPAFAHHYRYCSYKRRQQVSNLYLYLFM